MKIWKQYQKEIKNFALFLLIMAAACGLLYQPMKTLFQDPQLLRHQLQDMGILGRIVLSGIMMLQVIFVFLPGEIVEVMAGFIYGPIDGMMLCMLGSAVGSLLIYGFVKKWGRAFIDRFIGADKINQAPFLKDPQKRNILCFIIFFIPGTPKDILTYLIPLTDMKLSVFLSITSIARIPSIITSTIGGHALGVEDYTFSLIVFTITGLISLVGLYIYKKINKKKKLSYNL